MNKNSKSFLFLGISLLILLISMGSICAQDTNNTQSTDTQDISTYHDSSISDYTTTDKEADKSKIISKNKDNNNTKYVKTAVKQTKKEAVESTTTVTDYETLKQSWNNIKTSGNNETDYVINVKNGNYKFTEELEINTTSNIKSITINGENPDKTIFDAQNMSRHFNLNTTTLKVNFNNITFINGFDNNTGGSIYSKAVVEISNSKFINNTIVASKSNPKGGAIKFENNFTVTNTLFENNSIVNKSGYGAALSSEAKNIFGSIINCDFINNNASRGVVHVATSNNNITLTRCVFDSKIPVYYGSSYPKYMSYNYYSPGCLSNQEDLVILVNNKNNFNMLNQKNSNVTIQLYKYEQYYGHPLSNITLGLNRSFKIISSSDLINTTGIELSPENNYTAVINISNLPAKHEGISLYMDGAEVAKVVYNYTNIEISNITSKSGKTITIKTKLTSNNKELIQDGKVAFKLNGRTIGHAKVKIGFASFNYTIPDNYSSKDYILSVVYGGSSDFIEARRNATLKLEKLNTKTDVKTEISGNTLKININPTDENNKTITHGKVCVKINGKTQKTYTINGKSTYNFTLTPSWNNHEMKILVIYGENSNYHTSRCEIRTKIKLPVKNTAQVKKEDNIITNYYVSSENGLDTNPGTQNSPFKTIQKAISSIQANTQTVNIYLNGQFKGVGNTNLTIPGNLKINFIGVGNSSIDGEVNYTFSTETGVWGSSQVWESYYNGTGNWAMKITQGTGLITINNLTIKNCWNPGGTSITAYPTATIDNYGNLEVNNVSFIYNHGGVGASIRNNNGATLTVNNSLFEANRKSSSTGNYGAGLYNNGTAIVMNSLFQKNYGRWGTITNDKNLTLINSTIRDNIGYDGASTFKTGSGITINTAGTDFFNQGEIGGIVTVIDGCYFTNNDQLDIYVDEGCANITNCVFNKSTGIRTAAKSSTSMTNIINNTIIEPQGSTLSTSLSSSSTEKYALYLTGGSRYLVENNTGINLTCNAISVRSMNHMENSIIRNNTFDNSISLNGGNNNTFENNNITTKQEYAIYLGTQSNTKVINNHLVSSIFEGDGAVSFQGISNTVVNNTPKMALIRLNDENFYQYFDDDGNLKVDYDYIDQITLIGAIKDKTMILNKTIKMGQQNRNTLSTNIIIIINNGAINATGLKILNTNNQPVFILNSDNNIITGSNLTTNNTYTVIINNTKNNTITSNILIADIHVGDESVTTPDTNNITENTPLYRNYMIDDTTYNTYFNNDGTINVAEDKPIHLIIGDLNNKTLILNNNKNITLMNYHEIVAHNITIKTEANTTLNMTNITITNTNKKPVLEIRGLNTTITYTNLTSNDNVILFENTKDINIQDNNILLNVTDDVKSIIIKNVTNIQNPYNNNITITANITQDNKTHTIIAIEGINLTNCDLSYFNISITNLNEVNDNIYAINMINPERYNLTNDIRNNNIKIKGFNNVCAINMVNQTSRNIISNNIQISAKNTIAIKLTTSTLNRVYSNEGINTNIINLTSQMNNTGMIIDSCENIIVSGTNFTNMMSENIIAIKVYNSTNTTAYNVTMNLNGNNATAINIFNSNEDNITANNITLNSKDINQQVIILNNAEETVMRNNTIITTTKYTVKIDTKSSKSLIKNNRLYALKLGDDSILDESNNLIGIIDNTPVKSYEDLLLNDFTYDAFFDENGVLKDEVPTSANITVVGNLYNRVLNITRPVNIKADSLIAFTNTTIIVNAKNTNITDITINGYDNTKLIINSDNCNIQIPEINMENNEDKNITLITINGNHNKINITDITTINNINKSNNANIILLKITGKQNTITIGSMKALNFNNSTAIRLDNADKNYLNISGRVSWVQIWAINTDNGIIINNSNNNEIITSTIAPCKIKKIGFNLFNSSNNIIYYSSFEQSTNAKILLIENNSNYNKILGIKSTSSSFNIVPVSIINSNYNIFEGNIISFSGDAYPVEILNGFENEIKHNSLISTNHKANFGVYQETTSDDEKQNNKVYENYNSIPNYMQISLSIIGTLKVHQTITIRAWDTNFVSRGGNYTFFVNGKEIETVETRSNSANINYTITGDEGDKLIITIMQKNTAVTTNTTVFTPIIKLDSNILLPNITSNNGQTTVTAIVIDEEGNIQTNGRVAFKVNGKTVGVVNINNGVAQATFDSSKYSAKQYNITAVYGGNNMTEKSTINATLTITKTTPKIVVETPVVKRTNNTKITIKLTDDQENMIYRNTKIAIKLNGKTVTHTKSTNGIITLNMDLTGYKNSQYDITVVSGENNLYNTSRSTSVLKIE